MTAISYGNDQCQFIFIWLKRNCGPLTNRLWMKQIALMIETVRNLPKSTQINNQTNDWYIYKYLNAIKKSIYIYFCAYYSELLIQIEPRYSLFRDSQWANV